MNDLKFRAWDKWKNKMIAHHDGDFIKWHAMSNWRDCLEVMQFTGLKDCNGVEIYEGDLVKQDITINTEFHGSYGIYEIKFNNGGFLLSYVKSETGFKLPRGYTACFLNEIEDVPMKLMLWSNEPMELDQIEVIGNIYQHSHLLDGE